MTLAEPAPVGGVVVTLTSDTPAVASVPASVTIAQGATSATFTVTTVIVGGDTRSGSTRATAVFCNT